MQSCPGAGPPRSPVRASCASLPTFTARVHTHTLPNTLVFMLLSCKRVKLFTFPSKSKEKIRLSQNKSNALTTTIHAVFFLNTVFNSPQSWQKHCSPSGLPTTTLTFLMVNLPLCGAVFIVIVHPGGKFRLVEFKNLF